MRFWLFVPVLALCSPAFAHVTANPNSGPAGTYFETAFRVSHGCSGSATTAVEISFPKGTITAKPQHKPGWTVEILRSKLPKPVPAAHGRMASEQVDKIIWRGGTLPDDQYDTFGVLMKLPEAAGTLWFPVKQICETGETVWDEIPAENESWHQKSRPAPFVKIEPPTAGGHHH